MCGIIGAVSQRGMVSTLLDGLSRLEYRGYDSAGLAILGLDGEIRRRRVKGKVCALKESLLSDPFNGSVGLAHTRWATHGAPSKGNAHPHVSHEEIALVHNGIVENHEELRRRLIDEGYSFLSETDSEVIVHLFHLYSKQGCGPVIALQNTVKDLKGAFALGVIHCSQPNRLFAARRGSPLVIGEGVGENFIASDGLALLPMTQRFLYLEDGDVADISQNSFEIYDKDNNLIERKIHLSKLEGRDAHRGGFRHFMQKEIFEQPKALAATIEGRLSKTSVLEEAFGVGAKDVFERARQVTIVACGTSYHAGLVARCWIEEYARIPCQVEIASEYRYRRNVVCEGTLFVTLSQSGETADTLAALRLAKEKSYIETLSICNVPGSSLVRESGLVFLTQAGVEIGVASTKAFTTQLVSLLMLAIALGRRNGLPNEKERALVSEINGLPKKIEEVLERSLDVKRMARHFADKHNALFLGRGDEFPIALEGALKLKELSYIHAEAYPAGELKHGPLALVDSKMPVIAVAPNNKLLEKLKSNLQEVQARGGELFVFADDEVKIKEDSQAHIIKIPSVSKVIAPIVFTVPLQLLAYHVALIKGTDVDQPRNLAKSVTVE